jgi:hypothetical protein
VGWRARIRNLVIHVRGIAAHCRNGSSGYRRTIS